MIDSQDKTFSAALAKSKEKHNITLIVRGNQNYIVCDRCGKEVKEEDAMKSSSGKERNYAYCEECAKILYPNYRKIVKSSQFSPNPIMNNILREALARKEYRR